MLILGARTAWLDPCLRVAFGVSGGPVPRRAVPALVVGGFPLGSRFLSWSFSNDLGLRPPQRWAVPLNAWSPAWSWEQRCTGGWASGGGVRGRDHRLPLTRRLLRMAWRRASVFVQARAGISGWKPWRASSSCRRASRASRIRWYSGSSPGGNGLLTVDAPPDGVGAPGASCAPRRGPLSGEVLHRLGEAAGTAYGRSNCAQSGGPLSLVEGEHGCAVGIHDGFVDEFGGVGWVATLQGSGDGGE